MQLIVSACKGVDEWKDATQTEALERYIRGWSSRFIGLPVTGRWQGKQENSILVTGFNTFMGMIAFGIAVCRMFEQDYVFVEHEGEAYLMDAGGRLHHQGRYWRGDAFALASQFNGVMPETYTMLPDGSVVAAIREQVEQEQAA